MDLCIGSLKGCLQKAIDDDDERTMLDIEPNLERSCYDIDDEDWDKWDDGDCGFEEGDW